MRIILIMLIPIISVIVTGCSSTKHSDIDYLAQTSEMASAQLNVFTPRSKKQNMPVLIFIHGGNWNSGNKDMYGFLGRNFAKKDIVTVIPSYTLSPDADYDQMARQIAAAIHWTQKNISNFNGDPGRIFITGHSAGGHLGALAVMNSKYGVDPATISGIILNDAAGLDMKHYLEQNPPLADNNYDTTWSLNPEKWHDASPINFINSTTPPFMIYIGDKTYNSIKVANARFLDALTPFQPKVVPIRLNKRHAPMVLQYFWPWNDRFDEITNFISTQ